MQGIGYDSIAESYNRLYRDEQKRKLHLIKKHLTVRKSDLLLDLGCGTGLSSDFSCAVFGADPSLELLKQARIPKVLALAEFLPFKDRSFDVVVSVTAIHNFENIKKGLQEIRRVGKGKVALTVMKRSGKRNEITSLVMECFSPSKTIEQEKDIIFITN